MYNKTNKMETNIKKRFYVYGSWEEQFEILSTEEKATMLMNLFKYSRGAEPTLDSTGLKLVWAGMKYLLEEDDAKYQAAVQRALNTKPSKLSMAPQIKATEPQIKLLNHTDNVNVNVNEDENENDMSVERMMDKHWSPVINKGETTKYNKELIDDFKKWEKNNIKSHNTSSIPGVVKLPISIFDEMFNDI